MIACHILIQGGSCCFCGISLQGCGWIEQGWTLRAASYIQAWEIQHNVCAEVTFLVRQCGIELKVFQNVFHKEKGEMRNLFRRPNISHPPSQIKPFAGGIVLNSAFFFFFSLRESI